MAAVATHESRQMTARRIHAKMEFSTTAVKIIITTVFSIFTLPNFKILVVKYFLSNTVYKFNCFSFIKRCKLIVISLGMSARDAWCG